MKCINFEKCRNEARYYVRTTTSMWMLKYCGTCAVVMTDKGKLKRELPAGSFTPGSGTRIFEEQR